MSIVIAICERVDSLSRLLESLQRSRRRTEIAHEIIVANNAREAGAALAIEGVVRAFSSTDPRVRHLGEPAPGKCRAQNSAIRQARGKVLAFLDDDVVVTPEWLAATVRFFAERPYDAMQGPILVPPELAADEQFVVAWNRYRTISFVDYGPEMLEIFTLTGANMAVRRGVFERVGLFNEDLGPGRSGISEDVEFARRILRSGGRIGYEPGAAVYHEVDWSRLTESFFRLRHEMQGRSRLTYNKRGLARIVPDLLRAVWGFGWYSLTGNERKKYRAKGRYYHYRAMLAEKVRRRT